MATPSRLSFGFRVIARLGIVFFRSLRWRIDVQNLDHVPVDQGAILAFNHHSYVDVMMLAWGPIRTLRRPVRVLAKKELWSHWWTRWPLRVAGAVPVDRGSASARSEAFEAAVRALQSGDLVAVAPEQTISTSLELRDFRTGAARMAQQAGVPIVPVVGWGSHRAATKGVKLRVKFGLPVTVRFGPRLHVGPDDDPREVTNALRATMVGLLHQVQETYPDGAPVGARWVPARLGGSAPADDGSGDPPADPPESSIGS